MEIEDMSKNQNLIVILSIAFFTMFSTSQVFAQTIGTEEVAGITPDNPLYIFDVFGDNFFLSITTEPNERALLGLQIANERLAEFDLSITQGNIDSAEVAQTEHENVLVEVEIALVEQDIEIQSEETELELDEELKETLEIKAMLDIHKAEVDEVKQRVRIILEQNRELLIANPQLEDRINTVTSGLDNAIERVEVRVDEERTRIEVRFTDDFDKSLFQVSEKDRIFTNDAGQRVEIRLSNSGQGSFSSGSSDSGSSGSSDSSGSGSSGSSDSSGSGSSGSSDSSGSG